MCSRETNLFILAVVAAAIIALGCEDLDATGNQSENENRYRGLVSGETLYEAEKATGKHGCSSSTKYAGFTGSGFMDYGGIGTWIEWNTLAAQVSGEHLLTFRYGNGSSGNRQTAVIVNGQQKETVSFAPTGNWKNWRSATIKLSLKQGKNTIRLKANTSEGGPNLDSLIVKGPDGEPDDCRISLSGGEILAKGERVCSPNGSYDLELTEEGKLYIGSATRIIWTANFRDGHSARMQRAGNFVVHDSSGKALWNSKTNKNPGAYLTVDDDGRAVIRVGGKELWSVGGDDQHDQCPDDPHKTEPGQCDCGVPEGACGACLESDGCVEIEPTGSGDDSEHIQQALDRLKTGDSLKLIGNFKIAHTIYLPSGIKWILDGKITLSDKNPDEFDSIEVVVNGVSKGKRAAISQSTQGATDIEMSGGTYNGDFVRTSNGKSIRILYFTEVTHSIFRDMKIINGSDDNFTLGGRAMHNECRNLNSSYTNANGLSDKGRANKWYDCIAEHSDSDGWTPKCSDSEFHRCTARFNGGPGFGLYARQDTSPGVNMGAKLNNNKFYDTVSHDNLRSGFSLNISPDCGPGAELKNNFVQGWFYNNGMRGVLLRNKRSDGVVRDNVMEIIAYGNNGTREDGSRQNNGAGLSADGNIGRITGSVICYDNYRQDVDIDQADESQLTVFHPKDQNSAVVDEGNNNVKEVSFDCSQQSSEWIVNEYCL